MSELTRELATVLERVRPHLAEVIRQTLEEGGTRAGILAAVSAGIGDTKGDGSRRGDLTLAMVETYLDYLEEEPRCR